jgi:hypothetical protein
MAEIAANEWMNNAILVRSRHYLQITFYLFMFIGQSSSGLMVVVVLLPEQS